VPLPPDVVMFNERQWGEGSGRYWNGVSFVFAILLLRNLEEYDERISIVWPIFSSAGIPYWSCNGHSGQVGEKQQGGRRC
jgi:hypothetical protein